LKTLLAQNSATALEVAELINQAEPSHAGTLLQYVLQHKGELFQAEVRNHLLSLQARFTYQQMDQLHDDFHDDFYQGLHPRLPE